MVYVCVVWYNGNIQRTGRSSLNISSDRQTMSIIVWDKQTMSLMWDKQTMSILWTVKMAEKKIKISGLSLVYTKKVGFN